jgi:hypothetical protein
MPCVPGAAASRPSPPDPLPRVGFALDRARGCAILATAPAGIRMICPYCQQDLDPVTLSCPRCGAAHPGGSGGAVLGVRLRTAGLVFVLLIISTLILGRCVLAHLPSAGGQSGAGSSMTLTPQTKQADALRALLMMQQHVQVNQNTAPPPPRR